MKFSFNGMLVFIRNRPKPLTFIRNSDRPFPFIRNFIRNVIAISSISFLPPFPFIRNHPKLCSLSETESSTVSFHPKLCRCPKPNHLQFLHLKLWSDGLGSNRKRLVSDGFGRKEMFGFGWKEMTGLVSGMVGWRENSLVRWKLRWFWLGHFKCLISDRRFLHVSSPEFTEAIQ